jgi:hypothetical protein
MKKALWVILAVVVLGGAYALYQYNKPHRNYTEEEASIGLEGPRLIDDYMSDQAMADENYLDKIIEVKGVLIEKGVNSLVIEPGVYVSLSDTTNLDGLSEGDVIKIKGRVLGYDELMEEVKIDQATIYK